jgi:hypothetical protein
MESKFEQWSNGLKDLTRLLEKKGQHVAED